jgi:hypothetical protein
LSKRRLLTARTIKVSSHQRVPPFLDHNKLDAPLRCVKKS